MLVDSLTRSLSWSADDWVHLPDEKERKEYVMNEQGQIYRGTACDFSPMFWDFGQVRFYKNPSNMFIVHSVVSNKHIYWP